MNTLPNWEISIAGSKKDNLSVYKKIFSPYGIKINHSSYALTNIPMIEITILATEIKRGEMSQIGVSWPAGTSFQILPKLKLDPAGLSVTLDHLEQKGWGRVLASPTLLTQSGETATFHSGGEFPIKTSNQYNASVVWKQYGILMKIKPRADFTGKMDVQVECEVSAIDNKNIDNLPGLLINRISSHFNLSETKTIALSGLLREEWDHSRQGLPGLSSLPIFGSLFSSENYRNKQSELVFFVTPRIVR
jgi:pilus assembly protein CpaC